VSPEEVVRAELAAWHRLDVDEIVSFFADDAVWDNVPIGAVKGIEAIRQAVADYVGRMSSGSLDVINLAASGNIVLTERMDRFVYDGQPVSARVMGAFEIVGDKIAAWRDYFDIPNQPVR
jgi:limonene-1,2-epoxide hydrolase